MTIACNLPYHVYCHVGKTFLSGYEESGWERAVWFGITLPPNRAVGLSVLLENGAMYRQLPPHSLHFDPEMPLVATSAVGLDSTWTIQQAQAWDCFGGDAQVIEYDYLRHLQVSTNKVGRVLGGHYLFTIEFQNDGFSREPTQSKCFHCIELENGRLTLRPNDHLLWTEKSFTDHTLPTDYLRRQTNVYGVE